MSNVVYLARRIPPLDAASTKVYGGSEDTKGSEAGDSKAEDGALLEPKVPFLHEVWTWEGDTTILPGKWAAIVAAAFGDFAKGKDASYFSKTFAAAPQFDRDGVFFITSRSTAVATAMAWVDKPGSKVGRLHWLAVLPQHQRNGNGRALVRMVLKRHQQLGRTWCYVKTEDFRTDAIALYESEGFTRVDAPPTEE